jgi:hypothetical protein
MLQYKIDLTSKVPNEILERYSRYDEAARLEKQWINERLSWLFTPQSILFAALGFTFSDKINLDPILLNLIRAVIPLVAISISIVVFIVVLAACRMHYKWTNSMKECVVEYKKSGGNAGDLTFGTGPYWPASWARWSTLVIPIIFLVAWIAIFVRAGLHMGLCPS